MAAVDLSAFTTEYRGQSLVEENIIDLLEIGGQKIQCLIVFGRTIFKYLPGVHSLTYEWTHEVKFLTDDEIVTSSPAPAVTEAQREIRERLAYHIEGDDAVTLLSDRYLTIDDILRLVLPHSNGMTYNYSHHLYFSHDPHDTRFYHTYYKHVNVDDHATIMDYLTSFVLPPSSIIKPKVVLSELGVSKAITKFWEESEERELNVSCEFGMPPPLRIDDEDFDEDFDEDDYDAPIEFEIDGGRLKMSIKANEFSAYSHHGRRLRLTESIFEELKNIFHDLTNHGNANTFPCINEGKFSSTVTPRTKSEEQSILNHLRLLARKLKQTYPEQITNRMVINVNTTYRLNL